MSHKKGQGSTKNVSDSGPQYLGLKVHDGQSIKTGQVIMRQRGNRIWAGSNVDTGRDYTLYAKVKGVVKFGEKRKRHYDGTWKKVKVATIVAA